jgi:hypothetical protein
MSTDDRMTWQGKLIDEMSKEELMAVVRKQHEMYQKLCNVGLSAERIRALRALEPSTQPHRLGFWARMLGRQSRVKSGT